MKTYNPETIQASADKLASQQKNGLVKKMIQEAANELIKNYETFKR